MAQDQGIHAVFASFGTSCYVSCKYHGILFMIVIFAGFVEIYEQLLSLISRKMMSVKNEQPILL